MSAVVKMIVMIPRIETERVLLFDGLPEQPQAIEDGLDDAGATCSSACEKLDKRPA